LNVGFLLHFLNEQSERKGTGGTELNTRIIRNSMDRWWANCLRNDEDRMWIRGMIQRVRGEYDFEFTREMYEHALERKCRTGRLLEV
jgi:hypothetical protein